VVHLPSTLSILRRPVLKGSGSLPGKETCRNYKTGSKQLISCSRFVAETSALSFSRTDLRYEGGVRLFPGRIPVERGRLLPRGKVQWLVHRPLADHPFQSLS